MKAHLLLLVGLAAFSYSNAQVSGMADFTAYAGGTVITDQYLSEGFIFTGHNGSADPDVFDYGGTIGRVLKSDTWYNPLRVNFVQPTNQNYYRPARIIELDNPISSEVDYMSINVFDSTGSLVHYTCSASPESVVLDLGSPVAAYMIIDDACYDGVNTAYVIDNIRYYYDAPSNMNQAPEGSLTLFPNPSDGLFTIQYNGIIDRIEILDILGREVEAGIICSGMTQVKIEMPGNYILVLYSGQNRYTSKLIVI